MTPFLNGAVALITGASDGLGAATARLFGKAGARLVVTARRQDRLDTLARVLANDGVEALPVAADLSSDADVAALTKAAIDRFGRIDFVLNIGGSAGAIGTNLWEVTPEQWSDILAANSTGPFYLIRHILPHMMQAQTGRMLFLSSSATVRPVAKTGAYAASKAAVNGMVHTLALEMGGLPIAFNAFNPGPIDTATYQTVTTSLNQPQQMRDMHQSPEEAAVLPLWLCSPQTYGVSGEFIHWRDQDVYPAVRQFGAEIGVKMRL
ncbi:MAG: SDR family oxidoreductase [Rhodovulum sp.]|jgi:NAD(P)-dependent dehydrogenase (short-subunit alcohol dehydrogenase family)|uniref:SDR family NAD(P)-dependent oxidoreductase n=1 Tax=Rhodovulum sp. FJ3 TaxID=3079053 RepID=UPI0026D42E12|nr:SDR family oxidoreductase [Rhodovulum sp. FJ3]MCI5085669.1 SDR family oxidoreductase [Rhodovulum sp.]MDV4166503.1 SDR family oxidoreductase [Rhodovulum sp. FJ3]